MTKYIYFRSATLCDRSDPYKASRELLKGSRVDSTNLKINY